MPTIYISIIIAKLDIMKTKLRWDPNTQPPFPGYISVIYLNQLVITPSLLSRVSLPTLYFYLPFHPKFIPWHNPSTNSIVSMPHKIILERETLWANGIRGVALTMSFPQAFSTCGQESNGPSKLPQFNTCGVTNYINSLIKHYNLRFPGIIILNTRHWTYLSAGEQWAF